jgi:hypothetical protein
MGDNEKPVKAGRPAYPATRQVNMSRAAYLKALGHEHPRQSFVPAHQAIHRVVRITARLLNNNKTFLDAIKNEPEKTIGQLFHSKAKHVLRAMIKHGKLPKGLAGQAERAIKTGKGGSIGDAFFRNKGSGKPVAEFDHKLSVDAALKGKEQLERHAKHFADPTNPKNKGSVAAAPKIQQAVIIKQAILAHAKNAAKALIQRFGGATPPAPPAAKPTPQSLSVKSNTNPAAPGSKPPPAKPGAGHAGARPTAKPSAAAQPAKPSTNAASSTAKPTTKPSAAAPSSAVRNVGAKPSPASLRGAAGRASPAKPTSAGVRVAPPTASPQASVNVGKTAPSSASSTTTPNA